MKRKSVLIKNIKSEKGFSLINVILVLSAAALIGVFQFRDKAIDLEVERAVNVGKHADILNSAINSYVVAHGPALRKMKDDNCNGIDGCTPTVFFCRTKDQDPTLSYLNDNQCLIDDYAQLITEGYLPPGWVNRNPWGSEYATVVTRVPKRYVNPNSTDPLREFDFDIRAITVTKAPWIGSDGQPLLSLLGQAVGAGGPDLGMTVDDPLQANGLNRRQIVMQGSPAVPTVQMVTWNADASMNPFINGIGLLVMRAGFESTNKGFNSSELLLRDGSNAMQAQLDMNGFRINNVQDAHVGVVGRNLGSAMPTWVFKEAVAITQDNMTVNFPDCSRSSTDSVFTDTVDRGEPRILVGMERLENVRALGYSSNRSWAATDPFAASEAQGRAFGSYVFEAVPEAGSWRVKIRYYQDVQQTTPADFNHNAKADPTLSRGLAAVYCYYDNKVESACNGEAGCKSSGGTGTGLQDADLNSPPMVAADQMAPYQTDAQDSNTGGVAPIGAGDVILTP